MQYDLARTGGGTDVPVTVRPVVDMALVRPDVQCPEGRGVVGSAVGERDDIERGQRRSGANADLGARRCSIDTSDTAEYERIILVHLGAGTDRGGIDEITEPEICSVSDSRVAVAINVLEAGKISKKGVGSACSVRIASTPAKEGIGATHRVKGARIPSEEGVIVTRSVTEACSNTHKSIIGSRNAQDANTADVVLRRGVDDICRQRAARCAVAADVEVTCCLQAGAVLNVVWAQRRYARHGDCSGHGAAVHTLNLAAGHTIHARHTQPISRRGVQTANRIRIGSYRLARSQRSEGRAEVLLDSDLKKANRAVEATRTHAEVNLHGENAVGDGDIRDYDHRAFLHAGANGLCVIELELKVILATGRTAGL